MNVATTTINIYAINFYFLFYVFCYLNRKTASAGAVLQLRPVHNIHSIYDYIQCI